MHDFFTKNKILQFHMHQYQNLNEGVYLVQSGFRNDTAIISCPYISHRIEVYEAQSLKIFHGAQVFWTEVRRQYPSKRKGNREVVCAVVLAIKHCEYLCEGKQFLCTLKVSQYEQGYKVHGFPVNNKLPTFEIQDTSDSESNLLSLADLKLKYQKRYFWARFASWDYQQQYPLGVLTGLFQDGFKTPQVETQAILYNMEIFQNNCSLQNQHLLRGEDYLPIKSHREFNSMVFTIDPHNSVDIEDGLSLEDLGNQVYEVGIHISDVTSFKNFINRFQVANRATSIYLPHKTIHMLPPELIEFCALKSKKRRLAFSVLVKINKEGKILQTRFQKLIVKSVAQLSYEDAQSVIDDEETAVQLIKSKDLSLQQFEEMKSKIKLLKKIAFLRRKLRSNADMFDRNEVVFQLDQKNIPINIGLKKRIESEKLIEEFMLMANEEVAKKLVNEFGMHSLIIYHPKPTDYSIQNLNDYVSDFGVKFKAGSMLLLEEEIKKLFEKEDIKDELKQLLLLKAIQIQEYAVYTRSMNTYKGHYGLNLEYYTHFTSPVRRFADMIVHEQLQKCISGEAYSTREIEDLSTEIQLINKARVKSKKLKQQVVECFMNLLLFHKNEKIKTKGFIISLGLRSASIYIPHYNIIKEVNWDRPTCYLDKDKVQVTLWKQNGNDVTKEFKKNDSIDIEIYSEIHQEVRVNLIVKCQEKEIFI